jgi:hypothetical protein
MTKKERLQNREKAKNKIDVLEENSQSSSKLILIGLGLSESTLFLLSLVTFFIICLFVPVIAMSSTFLSFGLVFR